MKMSALVFLFIFFSHWSHITLRSCVEEVVAS